MMSVEIMQLRQALDYWMKMCDDYEKRIREDDQELDRLEREIDRLNAVITAYQPK